MATIQRFEEILSWQKARELTREIYAVSNDGGLARDFGLKDQLRRASLSIMSNIAEGFERSGNKEFIQFLSIAKGSAGEVRSQLCIALDQGYMTQKLHDELSAKVTEIGCLLSGLIAYLHQSDLKGTKFR